MPVILATQDAEIRRIEVQSQPGQIVHETLSQETLHKKRPVEWFKVLGPKFKPQYKEKKKKIQGTTSLKSHFCSYFPQ
jgi:hypothetical protein